MQVQYRITDPEIIDSTHIDKELRDGKHIIIQFSDTLYTHEILFQLNGLCEKYDESFGIRFYGHYLSSFNLQILQEIPNVKCLYVDCLTKAENILILRELQKLKKLSLGIYELNQTEILNTPNLKNLSELILGETKTKALNLIYLREYKNLKSLIIDGHTKNIEAVGELSNLQSLFLNSIKKISIHFVNKLKNLKTLKLILGGRENILEIQDNEIENLEIVWVRGFNDISNISKFKKLKTLLIEDNIQLTKVHFDKDLDQLCDLKILNCKTFNSLSGLEHLPSLNQLRISQTGLDFQNIINQKLPATLKTFAFYTTKKKVDEEIKEILQKKGYNEF
jgi:protein phosphatase 1 regulatory subunit 7